VDSRRETLAAPCRRHHGMGIVDLLEVIDIGHDHAKGPADGRVGPDLPFKDVMTAARFNMPVNASRLASSLSRSAWRTRYCCAQPALEQPALVDHCGDHFGDLAEDCLVDLSICALFAAREKKDTERAAGDEEGTGEARSAASATIRRVESDCGSASR